MLAPSIIGCHFTVSTFTCLAKCLIDRQTDAHVDEVEEYRHTLTHTQHRNVLALAHVLNPCLRPLSCLTDVNANIGETLNTKSLMSLALLVSVLL